jgi:hypothetical protein
VPPDGTPQFRNVTAGGGLLNETWREATMRAALIAIVLNSSVSFLSPALAQTSGLELQAGLGYARAFDGGGLSFAAAVERPLSAPTSRVQHALGGSLWYSHMSVGSGYSGGRNLMGVGLRYQLELGTCCGRARPFFAVPLQILRSDVPSRSALQSANLSLSGIPDPGPPTPLEDRMGDEWGWGTGLEVGFRIGLSQQLSAQTSVQGLYHRIYESSTRNTAWTIHGGITYQP